ncbi:FAD/NAD(P)-binding protein [Candidatus Azobacteroides pseudotrichonymphae]|uniref:Hydrogenase gamma subunit n=1 Tax=Azobacteroides pseudotrichonymphae genomovar. CFP2 TaxID=511995 RepID=B6YQG0_AZOPC|nr:FAD/NAD(P)-binding protein [Candidatus Azobacteroides pseudotrichonymphae]BAG83432.1 putative hydrogenase gamma subunit [Candidatus Azobacteroides pseudotrichonymphae genomovar. CFP2]
MDRNIYLPYLVTIDKIIQEAPGIKTFRLKFNDEKERNKFSFKTGQFAEYSVFGEGEVTFCIASPHTRKDYIECTFRQVGRVTTALANLEEGAIIGTRGPYGNVFPIDEWKGKNLVFIAGGIALPPIRSVIWTCLDNRADYNDISIFYGAKTAGDYVYKYELEKWKNRVDIHLYLTVDPGGETLTWQENIGFIPSIVEKISPCSKNTIAIVCGPPIMIKNTFSVLKELDFSNDNIFTTLENRMKCGFGKCGRCNVGKFYVCKDGPVFTAAQLATLPDEY